jgi:hypothetical protein
MGLRPVDLWSTLEFGPQAHNGVGALLQVLMANGDIQYGKLGLLIAFERLVEEMDGTVFFEGNVAQPGGKGIVGCPMVAGRRRDGIYRRIGVEARVIRAAGGAAKENYYR